ncbi:MAG TPA: carboxyl transferase domain-containing protein [Polyangiaceae bacterium]|jgi:propionyl-CoA carboxylase beta chain|nr:carboxyl transferase domain-containing protein [Polyangiaceae bacterium]
MANAAHPTASIIDELQTTTAASPPGPDEASSASPSCLAPPARRLAALFDCGRYEELDALAHHQARSWGMDERRFDGEGVSVATGRVHGQVVVAFAQDRRFMGGSLGEAHARKICKAMDLAERTGAPLVGLLDSGGARIQEGVAALAGYGEIFRRNVHLSGRVPQISVVLGPCAGGAVYSPAITDFVVLSRPDALMFVTGPKVVRQVMFEEVDGAALGGADVHAATTGVAHLIEPDEPSAIARARSLLSFLRGPRRVGTARGDEGAMRDIVPANFRHGYDVRRVIRKLADRGIPIVSLVDVPGFMPGSRQEHGGIIVHGAKLLYAYCEARVPRIAVVTRKAFGGAYIVMSSKHVGADVNLAWPGAQISVMGAEGAVEVLHGKELQGDADPRRRFDELCARYREDYMSVRVAAERGWIDEVIEPEETRRKIAHYLGMFASTKSAGGEHGNIPL